LGSTNGAGAGVRGEGGTTGPGVFGKGGGTSGIGVIGGGDFITPSPTPAGQGVYGEGGANATTIGVEGKGGTGSVTGGTGVKGTGATPNGGDNAGGIGVEGYGGDGFGTNQDGGVGVYGEGGDATGSGTDGAGVKGVGGGTASTGIGVIGEGKGTGAGVKGTGGTPSSTGNGGVGVEAIGGNGPSLYDGGHGVKGTGGSSSGGQGGSGVLGTGGGTDGRGIWGVGASNGIGVYGQGSGNYAVYGLASNAVGVYGKSYSKAGVKGRGGGNKPGVHGVGSAGYGVFGESSSNHGVYGKSYSKVGVYGQGGGNKPGVYGVGGASQGTGVYGTSNNTGGYGVEAHGDTGGSPVRAALHVAPQDADPSSGASGDIITTSGSHPSGVGKVRLHDGVSWEGIAGPGTERSTTSPLVTSGMSPYVASYGETVICDSGTGPIVIQLPPALPLDDGKFIEVKDIPSAPGVPITVLPAGAGTIDSFPTFVFPVPYNDFYGVKFRVVTAAHPAPGTPDTWAAVLHYHLLEVGYNTIEDEGVPLIKRTTLEFEGGGVTAQDSGGKTVVTIPGVVDTYVDQTLQTTGVGPATIATYSTLASSKAISMKVVVFARQSAGVGTVGDSAKYVVEALFERSSGDVVTSKDENFIVTFEDQAAWDVTFNISSQDIQVQVTGEASKTIEWRCQMEVSEHG